MISQKAKYALRALVALAKEGDSLMIGDKLSDLEAGRAAGSATALVLSGKGRQTYRELRSQGKLELADVVCTTLARVVDWFLAGRTTAG